jgi:hypothetical protein
MTATRPFIKAIAQTAIAMAALFVAAWLWGLQSSVIEKAWLGTSIGAFSFFLSQYQARRDALAAAAKAREDAIYERIRELGDRCEKIEDLFGQHCAQFCHESMDLSWKELEGRSLNSSAEIRFLAESLTLEKRLTRLELELKNGGTRH